MSGATETFKDMMFETLSQGRLVSEDIASKVTTSEMLNYYTENLVASDSRVRFEDVFFLSFPLPFFLSTAFEENDPIGFQRITGGDTKNEEKR